MKKANLYRKFRLYLTVPHLAGSRSLLRARGKSKVAFSHATPALPSKNPFTGSSFILFFATNFSMTSPRLMHNASFVK